MFKKRVISLILVAMLLVIWVVPAAADKPSIVKVHFPPNPYQVTDCRDYGYEFAIYNDWDEYSREYTFYDQDGNFRQLRWHANATHTFYGIPDTGKTLSHTSTDLLIVRDLEKGIWEFRGAFQRVIIPGQGPVFMDVGRKLFYGLWLPDGSLWFELIENAGPTSYTSMDFEALCEALAPEN